METGVVVAGADEVTRQTVAWQSLTVVDQPTAQTATDALTIIAGMRKGLTTTWKAAVEPYKDSIKKYDSAYKPLLDRLDSTETRIKSQILDWRRAEAMRVDAERRRIDDANRKAAQAAAEAAATERARVAEQTRKDAEAAGMTAQDAATLGQLEAADVAVAPAPMIIAPPPVSTRVVSDLGSVGVVKRWTFQVTDATLVPREYLAVDEVKIGKVVRAGLREIAGVRIYSEDTLSRR
jgi:hypothetical protein